MASSSAWVLVVDARLSVPVVPRAGIASASELDAAETSGAGFPRGCRLLKPAEFTAVFSRRQTIRGRHLSVHLLPRECPPSRLGLVIPKKQLRTAVSRNLVKRLIRETFRQMRPRLPTADYVFRLTSKPQAASRTALRRLLRSEIATLCERSARHRLVPGT